MLRDIVAYGTDNGEVFRVHVIKIDFNIEMVSDRPNRLINPMESIIPFLMRSKSSVTWPSMIPFSLRGTAR